MAAVALLQEDGSQRPGAAPAIAAVAVLVRQHVVLLPQRLPLPQQPLPACTPAVGAADTGHEQPGSKCIARFAAGDLPLEQHVEPRPSPGLLWLWLLLPAWQLLPWPPSVGFAAATFILLLPLPPLHPSARHRVLQPCPRWWLWPWPWLCLCTLWAVLLRLAPPPGRSRLRSSSREFAMTANAVPTSTSTAPHSVNLPIAASTSTATCAKAQCMHVRTPHRQGFGRVCSQPGALFALRAQCISPGLAACSNGGCCATVLAFVRTEAAMLSWTVRRVSRPSLSTPGSASSSSLNSATGAA